jgi:uncharacterized membrane protein YdcZ (DUF606 family)
MEEEIRVSVAYIVGMVLLVIVWAFCYQGIYTDLWYFIPALWIFIVGSIGVYYILPESIRNKIIS